MQRVAIATLVLAASCAAPLTDPPTVRDSDGLMFGWSCPEGAPCVITSSPTVTFTPPSCPNVGWGLRWARFYDVCVACPLSSGSGWVATDADCRPLACTTSADCPQFEVESDRYVYECAGGLCQDSDAHRHPRDVLVRSDVVDICYATRSRVSTEGGPESPTVLALTSAIDAACPNGGGTCMLPSTCTAP